MQQQSAHAAVFMGSGRPLEIREYPVVPPTGGDALLSLQASGICGTDIHIVTGRLAIPPVFIPGHEFVGRVEELGPKAQKDALGRRLAPGDIAVACVAQACGKCFTCRQGNTASCLQFGVTYLRDPARRPHFFGGFAEVLHHPAAGLVKLPQGVDVNAAAAFPCAGPTVIRATAYAGGLEKDQLVVVQGTGPVGLFAIAWAAKAGCRVVAIGSSSNPRRLELARKLGASRVLELQGSTVADRLAEVQTMAKKLRRGNGADVVIEASGAPTAIPEGLGLLRTLGTYVIPGQYSSSGAATIQPELITFKALRLIGSGQYTFADIGTYLSFLRKHPDLQRLFAKCIDHRYTIAQANQAMDDGQQGRFVKGIFAC